MALIDLDKFVESLMWMWDSYKNNPLFKNPIFNDIKLALDKQGLVYKDGKIVKTQRRISAEAKEDGYSESEDDRIRETLIDYFENYKTQEEIGIKTFFGISTDDIIAWLEKQGEQKPADTCDSLIIKSKEFPASEKRDFGYFSESADKVEPKFKVGDWVVTDKNNVVQIKAIEDSKYVLENTMRFSVDYVDKCWRKWTIQDAKDGDVLVCNEEILLFKSYSVQGRISLYCWYNGQTNNFHSKDVTDALLTTRNKICPATKEQRDTLMKAMADAGYTFDFEKKELKKVEQKPAEWKQENVEELSDFENAMMHIGGSFFGENAGLDPNDTDTIKEQAELLLELAPKTEWSEEDESMYTRTLGILGKCYMGNLPTKVEEELKWFKSLKQRIGV